MSTARPSTSGPCSIWPSRDDPSRVRRRLSLHRPEVLVQPVEGFPDELLARNGVPGFVDDVAFVLLARSPQAVERILRGLDREEVLVAAIEHQHGDPDARHEIDLVGL